jgi:NADPH-dependent 2,4-dienoyl-CoA reductase/sulfur reductase-like enzyme
MHAVRIAHRVVALLLPTRRDYTVALVVESRAIPEKHALVVGAGPAGAATASFLARGGAAVTRKLVRH